MTKHSQRTCKHCNNPVSGKLNFCSLDCKLQFRNELKFPSSSSIEGYDYIVCPLCKQRCKRISVRHATMHGFTSIKEMGETLGILTTCNKIKESFRGENNPAYQHNGKFSKWSKNFIHGYDEESHRDHKEKLSKQKILSKHKNPFCLEYWLIKNNGNQFLAEVEYNEYQSHGLNWFVNKYGVDDGTERYNHKRDNWVTIMTSKSAEEQRRINESKHSAQIQISSKPEKLLLNGLRYYLGDKQSELRTQVRYTIDSKTIIVDILFQNTVVEFYGDYWHCNPITYSGEYQHLQRMKTANEIWSNDKQRIDLLRSIGLNVVIIWESEFKSDPKTIAKNLALTLSSESCKTNNLS